MDPTDPQHAHDEYEVLDERAYDAFGLLRGVQYGSTATGSGGPGSTTAAWGQEVLGPDPVGFGGQFGYYTDAETVGLPLVLLTHRYYDPSAGRFLTRDPLGYGGGLNLYSLGTYNPVNETDPSGLNPFTRWVGRQAGRFGRWFEGSADVPLAHANHGVQDLYDIDGVEEQDKLGQRVGQGAAQGMKQGAEIVVGAVASAPLGGDGAAEEEALASEAAVLSKGAKFFKQYRNSGAYNQTTTNIGRFTRFSVETPNIARGTFTRWVKVVNQKGKTIQMYHDTMTDTGLLLHRGVKFPGPERHIPGIILRR